MYNNRYRHSSVSGYISFIVLIEQTVNGESLLLDGDLATSTVQNGYGYCWFDQ